MTQDDLKKEYGEHTITFDPETWTITVQGPEFDSSRYDATFRSLRDAQEEITKRVRDTNTLKSQNVRLSITALDHNGNMVQIDRINRSTGKTMGTDSNHIYPDVTWLREALRRRAQLRREIEQIGTLLAGFEVRTTRTSHSRIDVVNYHKVVEALRNEFDKATEKAQSFKPLSEVPSKGHSAA